MLRKANSSDFEAFYHIKCENDNIKWCGYTKPPKRTDLMGFWETFVPNSEDRTIYVIQVAKCVVGYIYVDYSKDELCLSVGVSSQYAGNGIATNSIVEIVQKLRAEFNLPIVAYIREDNIRSQKVFIKAGFKKTDICKSTFLDNGMHINLNKWINDME